MALAIDRIDHVVLTAHDVDRTIEFYSRVLGRPVRVRGVPAGAYAVPQRLFARVAPSLAGTMGLHRLIATSESAWTTPDVVERLGIGPLRTVEQVLREKAELAV